MTLVKIRGASFLRKALEDYKPRLKRDIEAAIAAEMRRTARPGGTKMSLTRAQWQEMRDAIKRLEDCVEEGIPTHSGYRKAAKRQVKKIKDMIQSVVGQME